MRAFTKVQFKIIQNLNLKKLLPGVEYPRELKNVENMPIYGTVLCSSALVLVIFSRLMNLHTFCNTLTLKICEKICKTQNNFTGVSDRALDPEPDPGGKIFQIKTEKSRAIANNCIFIQFLKKIFTKLNCVLLQSNIYEF